eukprot:gene2864-3559_t
MTTNNNNIGGFKNSRIECDKTILQDIEGGSDKVEIGKNARWTLSSAKPGFGIEQLRDDNLETYWQSDAQQPHHVNIQFPKKYIIENLFIFSDIKLDESYTPSKISIKAGTTFHDLQEIITTDLGEPSGWINIPLHLNNKPLKANLLQISILANHQNGRDTHIRQIKIYGKKIIYFNRFPFDYISFKNFGVDHFLKTYVKENSNDSQLQLQQQQQQQQQQYRLLIPSKYKSLTIGNENVIKFFVMLQNRYQISISVLNLYVNCKILNSVPGYFIDLQFYFPVQYVRKMRLHSLMFCDSRFKGQLKLPKSLESLTFDRYYDEIPVGFIPESVVKLKLPDCFNRELEIGMIPSKVRKLVFGEEFNSKLVRGVLPESIEELILPYDYNQVIEVGSLPSKLKKLELGYTFPLVAGIIPNFVKSLVLDYISQEPIKIGSIPSSVYCLEISLNYPSVLTVGSIPLSVINLKIDVRNSKVIQNLILHDGLIPSSTKRLYLGSHSKCSIVPIDHFSIPNGVEYLFIYGVSKQDQPIYSPQFLPKSVKSLRFINLEHRTDVNFIPDGIENLVIHENFVEREMPNLSLCKALKYLCIQNRELVQGFLPLGIKELELGDKEIPKGFLPESIKSLVLGQTFNQPLDFGIPNTLEYIKVSEHFNQPILPNQLPVNLKFLKLGNMFDQKLEIGSIPSSVETLYFGKQYSQEIKPNVIPENVKYLQLSNNFQVNFKDSKTGKSILPPKLEVLWINHSPVIEEGDLPSSLKYLILPTFYKHKLAQNVLPPHCYVTYESCKFKLSVFKFPIQKSKTLFPDNFKNLF